MSTDDLVATKRELAAAMATITKLLKNLSEANEKVKNLESLLLQRPLPTVNSKTESKLITTSTSTEEVIAITQLERIRTIASERQLTLEEARIYDLLVKNKKLSQEDPEKSSKKGQYRDVSDIELMKLVSEAPKNGADN